LRGRVVHQKFHTKVDVDDQGFGTKIDWEDDLGYDDVTGMVNATSRFADCHRLSLGYNEF
jgi:hypothetical protein